MIPKYRILYKPPAIEVKDEDPDTWSKVFYLDKYETREKLDLEVKILELIKLYNMKEEYIEVQDLEQI